MLGQIGDDGVRDSARSHGRAAFACGTSLAIFWRKRLSSEVPDELEFRLRAAGALMIPWLGAAAAAGAVWAWKRLRRDRSYDFRARVVVITGGTRGFGIELARAFAAQGARIAVCARTEVDVERAVHHIRGIGAPAMGRACDVTVPDQVEAFIRDVLDTWGRVDVLVNNAGIIQAGPASCMTLEDYREAMDTHFWGPLSVVRAVLPHMRALGGGRIVNVSSLGGKISLPHMLPYSASKFALTGLSEGLRAELAHENIVVTTVLPGLMRTGSPRNATFKSRHRDEHAWFSILDSLPGVSMHAGRAARQVVEAVRTGEAECTPGMWAAVAIRLKAALPDMFSNWMAWTNRLLPPPGGIGTESRKGWESASKWSPSLLTRLTQNAEVQNFERAPAPDNARRDLQSSTNGATVSRAG